MRARHAAARRRATSPTCSRRPRSRCSSACRSTRSPRAPRRCGRRAAAASCCGCPAASRSSTTPTTRARPRCAARSRRCAPRPAARGRSPCSARCSSSATHATRLHDEAGAAAAAAGLDLLIAVGGPPARALADAARPGRHAATAVRPRADERRRGRPGAAAGPPRRSRARQGLARHRHRPRRRPAEGGVRLMLYHLLYPLHAELAGLQRDAVHHVPHRGGEPDRARHQPVRSAR